MATLDGDLVREHMAIPHKRGGGCWAFVTKPASWVAWVQAALCPRERAKRTKWCETCTGGKTLWVLCGGSLWLFPPVGEAWL